MDTLTRVYEWAFRKRPDLRGPLRRRVVRRFYDQHPDLLRRRYTYVLTHPRSRNFIDETDSIEEAIEQLLPATDVDGELVIFIIEDGQVRGLMTSNWDLSRDLSARLSQN